MYMSKLILWVFRFEFINGIYSGNLTHNWVHVMTKFDICYENNYEEGNYVVVC